MEKVYFIYVTENLINGKLYIGQHTCAYNRQFSDGYLGSGTILKGAIKKYGKENFRRIIIDYADSPEELNKLEEKYVDEEIMNSNEFYNLKTGGNHAICSNETRKKLSVAGMGKPHPWNVGKNKSEEIRKKISNSNKGKHRSEETKRKISEALKGHEGLKGEKNPWYGKHLPEEARQKMREAKKNFIPWNKGKTNVLSEEQKREISERNKRLYKGENNPMYGKHWKFWNNGEITIRSEECPEGFIPGRLKG